MERTDGSLRMEAFAGGTKSIALAISGNKSAFKLAGGGSTVEAINSLGITDAVTHVSTGGGASLEFLEGRTLPGMLPYRSIENASAGLTSQGLSDSSRICIQ